MEIIDQHTKGIMEECKERALDAGLRFDAESLEYIVTNYDLLDLSPKGMIPTLYDYWVHDLEVIKSRKEYELYPHNPFETVINSRPAISFYNDNNPDWLNVMIFYHVLAHVDFMQNNHYYRHTWDDDFVGRALADKRLINDLRAKHGRWVDYVIEFTRGIDNITGYYRELSALNAPTPGPPDKLDYFFDVFLQKEKKVSTPDYLKEIDNYNKILSENPSHAKSAFLSRVKAKYNEFEPLFEKYGKNRKPKPKDLIQFLMDRSRFLNSDENEWMKLVMEIVRDTALYFEPQRRTKIMNEGWASYWHNELFLKDDRIKGHEVDYAKINAFVTSVPRVGFNPYAIGWRLFEFVKDEADKGRLSYEFEKILDVRERKEFDKHTGEGLEFLFKVRRDLCDFTFINTFVDQDFVDRYNLVVVGERINQRRMTREYYIKSKKADDYKELILKNIIHPPHITIDEGRTRPEGTLHLVHHYEGKQLVPEFIDNTMIGIEYLWGGEVELDTWAIVDGEPKNIKYHVKDRKVSKK